MPASGDVAQAALVLSTRPSMHLPTALKHCGVDPEKVSVLNEGSGSQPLTGLLMSAHLMSAWQTSTCRFSGSSGASLSNDWKLDMKSKWTLMSVASRVL